MLEPPSPPTARLFAQVQVLLKRYGVLTREHVAAEPISGGFTAIYGVLRQMEESGHIRRGYFVEGLGGAQFALPGAVDRLRSYREEQGTIELLAATDPACAYGVTVSWPNLRGRLSRIAGAYVVLEAGEVRLYVERGGRSLLTSGEVTAVHIEQLGRIAERQGRLEVRSIDGEPVTQSRIYSLLVDRGFETTHKGLMLYPRR